MKMVLFCLLSLCMFTLAAQGLRDPTIAPAEAGGSATRLQDPLVSPDGPISLVIVDGKPNLISGTRLYSEGQMFGRARIEKITETEVWLKEAGQLRKVQQFPGVVRRNVIEKASP